MNWFPVRWIDGRDLYLLVTLWLIKLVDASRSEWLQSFAVHTFATTAFLLSREKRRRTEAALRRAFANSLTAAERRAIAWQSFHTFWQEVFAIPPRPASPAMPDHVAPESLERVQEALRARRGAILFESSAFGHRARAKQILRRHGIAVHTVHIEQHMWGLPGQGQTHCRRRYLRPMLEKWEKEYVAEIVYLPESASLGYARRLLSILGDNGVACISGDGNAGKKYVELEFLGQPKAFTTGAVSLARVTGAPLLPIFCVREPDQNYRLIIETPLQLSDGADRERSLADGMAQYAQVLESYVRQYPGQYRNWR
jgi:KDO2-lipid IV(A) lauroyltransferase